MFSRISNLFIVCIMLIALGSVYQAIAATVEEVWESFHGDVINTHDIEAIASFWADDAVFDYLPSQLPLEGKEAIVAFFEGVFQAFPDWQCCPDGPRRQLVSGNIVVAECTTVGTHEGEWAGIPATGKILQTIHMDICEFEGDKITRLTTYDDAVSQMIKLGLMPVPELPELVPSFTLPEPEPTGLAPLEAAKNLVAVYNTHNLDAHAKQIQPDADILLAPLGVPMGRDAYIAALELYFLTYSDLQQEIVRMVDMGDGWVLVEVVFKGTNDGPYFGVPATGNSAEVRGAWLARFDTDGLMTYLHVYWDELTTLTQLGLFPPPEVPTEGYDNVFFMSLLPGLNMISLPLEPITPYTARSFAESLSATTVIKLDEARQRFVGFTLDAPDDGFAIEGGKGYIVNVPDARVVAFTGAAWTNQPPVEMAPAVSTDSAWAFVVSGRFDDNLLECENSVFAVTVRNTRTNAVATDVVRSGYFAAAFADLNRKNVVQIGDSLEVKVQDKTGEIASETLYYMVTAEAIHQAFLPIVLKHVGIPRQTALLPNYPNPFNPETSIPYQLREPAEVVIHIYDTTGRLIRTLNLGYRDAGFHFSRNRAAYWDGLNSVSEMVASGIYFYQMKAGDFSAMRRMVIVK